MDTVEVFRGRLLSLLRDHNLNRAQFAKRAGVERSTLSQVLSPATRRLPRAETLARIAREFQVSADWLLGLTDEGRAETRLLRDTTEIEEGAGGLDDERLRRWHLESAGYKIRYIPTSLPDLLKTEAVIRYEYRDHKPSVPTSQIEQAQSGLAYSRLPETDVEVCTSFQLLEDFAMGGSVWRGLTKGERRAQLDLIVERVEELYPTFRWFLFDGSARFAAPMTIFGPMRAALYLGDMYLVLNAREQVQALTRLFDSMIRAAVVQPPDVGRFIQDLTRKAKMG